MRVIAGKYKGTKLVSPHGEVRPTTDIAKGSLFSVLTSKGLLIGARCLDVFCGSGSLGIEALSRGAKSCVFADADERNVKANLLKLRINERVIAGDFRRTLKALSDSKFDLVFCDPPYKTDFAHATLELIVKYDLLADDGAVILEHANGTEITEVPGTYVIDRRAFGAVAFDIIGVSKNESDICGDV